MCAFLGNCSREFPQFFFAIQWAIVTVKRMIVNVVEITQMSLQEKKKNVVMASFIVCLVNLEKQ